MKNFLCRTLHALRARSNRHLAASLREALSRTKDKTPCFVVAYNKPSHVHQMVRQLRALGIMPIIFDNKSSCSETRALLKHLHPDQAYVLEVGRNLGHKVGFVPGVYEHMPDVFAYTDPDLKFNDDLPADFYDTLHKLTEEYDVFKAGFSLDSKCGKLAEGLAVNVHKCKSIPFKKTFSLFEWEAVHWRFPLHGDDNLVVYAASVDTTFAVYNKKKYSGSFLEAVRVAGDFLTIHLPWYPELDIMDDSEKISYLKNNKSTSWVVK